MSESCAQLRLVNRSQYPSAEVRAIVCRSMRGDRRRPPTVVVHDEPAQSPRAGFTPFDRSLPIDLYLERPGWYPKPGAPDWRTDLALSAAHEDYHFHHPGQPCPQDHCEILAERYAHAHIRDLQRRQQRLQRRARHVAV